MSRSLGDSRTIILGARRLLRLAAACLVAAALTLGGAAAPGGQPALADPCPLLADFTVTSVQPAEVSNSAASTLVITGAGFCDGVTAVVEGFGGLETTLINENLLNAKLPAGVPAREYRVQVINGDGADLGDSPPSITVHGPTSTPEPERSSTPTATPLPTFTPGPTSFVRPVINIASYGASSAVITPGQDFDFEVTFANVGQTPATDLSVEFVAGDISPRATGGVTSNPYLAPGESWRFYQPLAASDSLWGADTATVQVNVTYYDANAETYTDSFTLTFRLTLLGSSATPSATPTASATAILSPRLLIGGYDTGQGMVQPGDQFDLALQVQNVGNAFAKGVTMIFEGSQTSGGGGTPGGSGDFGTFAPQSGSNLRFVGDLSAGQSMSVAQTLLVNGSAASGAYPLKFTFVYTDELGQSHTDEQVITVPVVAVPRLEISFYEEPETFLAGESGLLPLQVVNQGLNSLVLNSMRVDGGAAQFANNVTLVGTLDPGNFFTLDAVVIPEGPGPLEFTVTVDYTDAFNQQQVITETMQIEVAGSALTPTPDAAGGQAGAGETGGFLQTVWRAILGIFGLGG